MEKKKNIPQHIDSNTFEDKILPSIDNPEDLELLRLYKRNNNGLEYNLSPGISDEDCRKIRGILKRIGLEIESGSNLTRKDALKRIAMGLGGAVLFPGVLRSEGPSFREDLLAYYRVYYSYYSSRYSSNYLSYYSQYYSNYSSSYQSSSSGGYNSSYNYGSSGTRQGTLNFNTGARYVGKINNSTNQPDGQGTLYTPDGHQWTGSWNGSSLNGHGTWKNTKTSEEYEGNFYNGKFSGYGTWIKRSTGEKYVGYWQDGVAHGQGTHYRDDGRKYVGEFRNNKYNGRGTMYDRNGNVLQQGRWSEDKYLGP